MLSPYILIIYTFLSITYLYTHTCMYTVYYVSEKGWTQVWKGDTTDMYYGYYPITRPMLQTTPEEGEKVEEAKA